MKLLAAIVLALLVPGGLIALFVWKVRQQTKGD